MYSLLLIAVVVFGADKFVPDEVPQPPQTAKEGVLPPLTDLAEKHGMKEHKAYTEKLNKKVVDLEQQDVKAGNDLVHSLEGAVEEAKKKLELAKESRDTAKEKVQNDERNHVAAGIFMHAEIKEATAQRKKYKELADTAEARAQVKVKQAQADVSAKNEIISQKDSDIERLGQEVKAEQTKAEAACDARIGKQRREHAEKEKSLTKIKDDEIQAAKESTKRAEEATRQERENCQAEAEAQKGRCQTEVDAIKTQVSQLQASIKQKNDDLKAAGDECTKQVAGAKNQCNAEKAEVQAQAKAACAVEVENEKEKVKAADQSLIAEKKKLADIEKRLTQDKDAAIAKCDQEKETIDRAARETITKNQQAERKTCDDAKNVLKTKQKQAQAHLRQEITQLRNDYKKAISTMQATQAQEKKALRDQLRKAESERDQYKDQSSTCKLSLKQAQDTLKANFEATQNTAANLNLGTQASDLETDVAVVGPQNMAVSSSAMVVYVSLVLSSLFLSGLVVKLRGESMRTKKYNAVLTEA